MLQLLLAVAIVGIPQTSGGASECVRFTSGGRLLAGRPFAKALPRGLEFRLHPDSSGWSILVVDPARPTEDFIALVSPPYKFAQHLSIDAREQPLKLNVFDRELAFVLNTRDYQRMFQVHQENWYDWEPVIKARESLTKGALYLHFTGFGARAAERNGHTIEGFAWITFEGEACVPR